MRKLFLLVIILSSQLNTQAQDFGLSFSYFIPKDGYFSTPISPFSIRGLGVSLNRFIAIETGASLYRMSGLQVKDTPLTTSDPLVGPNFTLLIPLELVLELKGNNIEFDIKGGALGFLPFGNKLNTGNLDRAIREYESWQVANADADFESSVGFGWMAGVELTVYVTQQWGISLETNYLAADAKFPIKGTYTGGNTNLETKAFDYTDAKLDLTGLEFSIGIIISSGGGKSKSKRRR